MYEFTALAAYKLLFLLELLVSEFIYTFRLKRRKHFYARAAAGVVVCYAAALAFPILDYGALYSSAMFLCLFAVTLVMLRACYDEPTVNIVFCAIAAYTARHFAFQIYSLLSTAGNAAVGILFDRNPANVLLNLYGSGVIDAAAFGPGTVFWALIYIFVYIVSYALLFVLFGRTLWQNDELKINNVSMLVLAGVVLLVDILLNAVLVYITEEYNPLYTAIMYVYNLLCCLLTLYMQFSMINIKKLKKELSIVSHMWQQDREQYEISKENIDLINIKCHDLKHQIRQVGAHESISAKSLGEIEKLISIYDSVVKTGNEALDVILTEKSLICAKKQISLTCIADGERLGFMDAADIYSLFGNIVDNAMEAVSKLADAEKRVIGLNVHAADRMLAVSVNNYYEGAVVMDKDGLPVTTKRDKDFHGYGMRSIRMLVEKYDGDMTVTARDGVFSVSIVFPTVCKTGL